MQVIVRCLDLPEGKDLLWTSFNSNIPREGEGLIIGDAQSAKADVYEVVRVTHTLKVWSKPPSRDGSFDNTTVWVKSKEAVVGRWSKP
jgi:hypothetical protein